MTDLETRTQAVRRAVNVVKSDLTNVSMIAGAVRHGARDAAEGRRIALRCVALARRSLDDLERAVEAMGAEPAPEPTEADGFVTAYASGPCEGFGRNGALS